MYEIYCKLKEERGVKDADVVRETGITKSTFSDWKSGRSKPKNDKLQKIADYFGVTVDYLTTGIENKEYAIFEKLLKERNVTAYRVSKETGITQSTLSDWKRGRSTPKSENMKKIADYFGISIDYLMTGKEQNDKEPRVNPINQKDIKEILSNTEQLLKQDGLMFDGDPASPEAIDSILSAMQIGMEMAKKKNKKKYTPKKYKKD